MWKKLLNKTEGSSLDVANGICAKWGKVEKRELIVRQLLKAILIKGAILRDITAMNVKK